MHAPSSDVMSACFMIILQTERERGEAGHQAIAGQEQQKSRIRMIATASSSSAVAVEAAAARPVITSKVGVCSKTREERE